MRSRSRPAPAVAVALAAMAGMGVGPAPAVGAQPVPRTTVAFRGVTVVPMDAERTVPGQTVIVSDGRITAVGPANGTPIPEGATIVDGRGKWLMPGLSEFHAHIPPASAPVAQRDRVLTLYVVNGVTTARGMLGDQSHLALRAALARGEVLGPRLVTSGPSFNGTSVKTVQAGIDSVVNQHRLGYDFLKIHPGVPREVFDSVAATAHRLGIPFAGHVPLEVGWRRALEARYASIDHVDGLLEAMLRPEAPLTAAQGGFFGIALVDHLDESRLPALVAATKAAGVAMVPTVALLEAWTDTTPPEVLAARPEMRWWPPAQVANWTMNKRNLLASEPYTPAQRARFTEVRRRAVAALHRGGVRFLLGSDAPQVWNVPGFSIHRELAALVRAGFTPYEALRTGTVHVAEYLGEGDRSGTVAVGRRADLLLLDGDPLADVANAGKLAGVMVDGRWLPRAELDRRLAALANP
jgi:imidazolonepropionase-like amidohydrolase